MNPKSHPDIRIERRIALTEENCRLNLVKAIIDCACGMIMSGVLGEGECLDLLQRTRAQVMVFIPGQEETYDLIYQSRLKRILEQFISDRNED